MKLRHHVKFNTCLIPVHMYYEMVKDLNHDLHHAFHQKQHQYVNLHLLLGKSFFLPILQAAHLYRNHDTLKPDKIFYKSFSKSITND